MKKNKALVLLSGGQDSTICLFWALKHYAEVHAVSFYYGQRHATEVESAIKIGKMAGVVSHEVVPIPNCLVSTSPLLCDKDLEQYESFAQMDEIIGDRVELTFVPMRNPLFLTIAVNRAVQLGCAVLVTGICQQDNANYADTTEDFRKAFNKMVVEALACRDFEVVAPLMFKTKAESIHLAMTYDGCMDALAYSHTSYAGDFPPLDQNHATVLRAQGFLEAGVPDPLILRAVKMGLMELPDTANYKGVQLDLFQL